MFIFVHLILLILVIVGALQAPAREGGYQPRDLARRRRRRADRRPSVRV